MKKLQEELIQSRKMQEKINQQNRSRQDLGTSSMSSQSSTSLPAGTTVNRWAEIADFDNVVSHYLYERPIKQTKYELGYNEKGTRVFVLEKQGNWYKVKMEDNTGGWLYGVKFDWLN